MFGCQRRPRRQELSKADISVTWGPFPYVEANALDDVGGRHDTGTCPSIVLLPHIMFPVSVYAICCELGLIFD